MINDLDKIYYIKCAIQNQFHYGRLYHIILQAASYICVKFVVYFKYLKNRTFRRRKTEMPERDQINKILCCSDSEKNS